jgi:two-component system, chemotaxis family, sensor kinase CheA
MAFNDQLAALFREEAAEHLATLETTLLELENRPQDPELIAQAFRALHTIKGSSAMAGFERITAITHEVESVFVQIRQGKLQATPDIIALTLETKDLIRSMLDPTAPVSAESHERVRLGYQAMLARVAEAPAPIVLASTPPAIERKVDAAPALPTEFRVTWVPHLDFFQNGSNPLGILAELADLGACRTTTKLDALPGLEDLDPENCHLQFELVLQTHKTENDIRDVFIFVEDRSDLRIATVAATEATTDANGPVQTTSPSLPAPTAPEATAARVEKPGAREAAARPSESASSIRVSAQKLDSLVDLVGELVIAQARLAQLASTRGDDQLLSVAEDIGRLSAELRDNTLDIRMVPIGTTFVRFKRLVHDLASELGKDIQLETEGAETELDKTMIERLFDPLVHLIRNSCDHGIESPDLRRSAGKNPTGTVRLRAYHSGQSVFVEIRDDGAGLDPVAIRKKAIASGLLDESAQLSADELNKLIFLPGFSTAKTVSNVSGRGVGMDVVKRSVEALRGQIDIASDLGKGSTIRLQLPLTLAIIEGLLVAVGDARFVLPMALVEECVELTMLDIQRSHDNQLANVRGELVPYIRLRDWFGSVGSRPAIEQIAITTIEGKRYGFVVDGVVGQHQTVIKSLGRMYQNVRGVSGATILGDGTLALIVDVPALLRSVQQAA